MAEESIYTGYLKKVMVVDIKMAKHKEENDSFKLHLEKFREYLQSRNFSSHSIKNYGRRAKYFLQWISKETKIKGIEEITSRDINGWRLENFYARKGDGSPYSPREQSYRVLAVKSFFGYLKKAGKILSNPAADVEIPKQIKKLPGNILSVSEVTQLLECPDTGTAVGLRDRTIMELLYSTGVRAGELREIKLTDIYWEEKRLVIREGKGGYERVVPIGRMAMQYLREYFLIGRKELIQSGTENPFLFLSKNGDKLGVTNVWYGVSKYARLAGIAKRVYPHGLRHACATHMLKGGADIRYIQQLLGHRKLDSTQIYTQVENVDLKAVHRKTHPRG